MAWTLSLEDYKAIGLRISRAELAIGKLAVQLEQFMRTGLADADNQFSCQEFDEEQEARAFSSVYGPLMK